jgi:F0F1-type ATP synthase assembly protein I
MQLSWVFAFSVLLPLGLGIWLDQRLHRSPLFFFIGAVIGILAGTVGTVRIATRTIERIERRWTEEADAEEPKEDQTE